MLKLIIICSLALTASMSAFSECTVEVPKDWIKSDQADAKNEIDACAYKDKKFSSDLSLAEASKLTATINSKLTSCKCDIDGKDIGSKDESKGAHCASSRSFKAETVEGKTVIKVNSTVVTPE